MKTPRKTQAIRRALAAVTLVGATLSAAVAPSGAIAPCLSVIHVDADAVPANPANNFGQSWADAIPDLQTAIGLVCPGITEQIWIAEGSYTPDASDRSASFILPDLVELIGGFEGDELSLADRPPFLPQSELTGLLTTGDRSYQVVRVPAGRTGILRDLTVSGGNADGIDGAPSNGGGIYLEDFDGGQTFQSLRATNVEVQNNDAVNAGGGIYAGGAIAFGGSIRNNSAAQGGGVFFSEGLHFFSGTIQGNSADFGGGFVALDGAEVLTNETAFTDNRAARIGGAVFAGGTLQMDATDFAFNSAAESAGAIHFAGDELIVTNSQFLRNRADGEMGNGGALSVFGPATVQSTTFFANSATSLFGAIHVGVNPEASLHLQNSIVWGNSAPTYPQMRNEGGGTTTHSDIEGSGGSGPGWSTDFGTDGGGNIDADPDFVAESPIADLQLLAGSPAIDAGDAAFASPDQFDRNQNGDQTDIAPDFFGGFRIEGSGLDMGALEFGDENPDGFRALPRPCAVYDSRFAAGNIAGPIAGGEVLQIRTNGNLAEGQGGDPQGCVPVDASSATFLISAKNPLQEGNLRLSGGGVTPTGGVVNFAANGLDNANTVTVPVIDGTIDIGANGGPSGVGVDLTDVRIDAIGYWGPDEDEVFVPLTPCAVGDSRHNHDAEDPFEGPFAPGAVLTYDVVDQFSTDQGGGDQNCGVPANAVSVVMNVVAINPDGTGSVTAHAVNELPIEGTPYAPLGMNNAAVAIVPLTGGETINVTVAGEPDSTTHVRLVVLGYITYASGSVFVPVNPCAAFDTRANKGSSGSFTGLRQGGQITTYDIAGTIDPTQGGNDGSCGVPEGASGVLLNLVAINAVGEGNLQVSAAGVNPSGGVLNFAALTPAMNNANAVPVELGFDGEIDVFVNGGPNGSGVDRTHIRGVVLGYYLDAPFVNL